MTGFHRRQRDRQIPVGPRIDQHDRKAVVGARGGLLNEPIGVVADLVHRDFALVIDITDELLVVVRPGEDTARVGLEASDQLWVNRVLTDQRAAVADDRDRFSKTRPEGLVGRGIDQR